MPMKIAGQVVDQNLPEDFIVLRAGTEKEIVVRARAFRDFDDFDALCTPPEPPGRNERGKGWVPNPNDPTYKQRVETYNKQRVGWMVIQSLYEFEFETVNPEKPKTWTNWEKEMKDSGFTQIECNLTLGLVLDVNSLNEAKMREARESFSHGQEVELNGSNSQNSEPESSPSGAPASDGE